MDSLSQLALGAAVSVAVMGRRTAVWKAALWGGVAGTLPDLDVFIDRGGPVLNMVLHRGETHALFWLTLFSLPFAAALARLSGDWAQWRRWWLAMWLALVTHPLLDAMTVYGTQLALPFSNFPYAVGSVFIIDPLYTVPLLVGAIWAVAGRGSARSLRANTLGLLLSTAYLVWGFAAQQHVQGVARASLASQKIAVDQVLVTPTAFNSLLWRVVAMSGDSYHEGYYSLLDGAPAASRITFDRYPRGHALASQLQDNDSVQRLSAFTKGFFAMRQDGARVLISDLRMGQEPNYTFTFHIANRQSEAEPLAVPQQLDGRGDVACLLRWLRKRMVDETVPSPVTFCRAATPSLEPVR